MMRRAIFTLARGRSVRGLASDSEGKGPKDPSPKDILGQDLMDAVDNVVGDLHGRDATSKKASKSTLLSKLISTEKETFSSATRGQTAEMIDDPALLNLLNFVAKSKQEKKAAPRLNLAKKEKQGLVLLRKEIFYRAKQDGYSAAEAQKIAEKAAEEALERVSKQRKAMIEGVELEKAKEEKEEAKITEKEKKLHEAAYEMAEKMLYQDDLAKAALKAKVLVKPDPSLGSLLDSKESLGIFKNLKGLTDSGPSFWEEWDLRTARITNQSMGPENSFEEQIEWTQKGKQWPYPINNEYLLGEEENVSFIEHVFLERHLPSLGIPKNGPIAHFMHLVCVGLSKNPYMTASKKMEHLQWFAKYFNEEKEKIMRLHDEEQLAAAQNA